MTVEADEGLLTAGDIDVVGRMPWSSNGTYLVEVHAPDTSADACVRAIYKPRDHERHLWDFPAGLDRREVAAFELSRALGWHLVPTTVLRDGPFGVGSVQRFVDADFEQHYFTLHESGRHLDRMRAMCLFDIVANNTDRKSGHCLVSVDDEFFGIDHGLCFHEDFKLRTVIWDFAGQPVPDELRADVTALLDDDRLAPVDALLTEVERDAVRRRIATVAHLDTFPRDTTGRAHPWPLV